LLGVAVLPRVVAQAPVPRPEGAIPLPPAPPVSPVSPVSPRASAGASSAVAPPDIRAPADPLAPLDILPQLDPAAPSDARNRAFFGPTEDVDIDLGIDVDALEEPFDRLLDGLDALVDAIEDGAERLART